MRIFRGLAAALAIVSLSGCAGAYVAGDVGAAATPRHIEFAPSASPRS